MPIHLIEDFDVSSATSTGGVTGSKQVKYRTTGHSYQLKPSILTNSLKRRLKAGNTDRENFGEVIAAFIGQAVLPEATPVVELVYDKTKRQVLIASKYMTGKDVTILDTYAQTKSPSLASTHGHVTFVLGEASEGQYSLGGEQPTQKKLRKDLARALAISALVGDHDVNPGNMLVITSQTNEEKIARIDFGHAFNDLLNAPMKFGGQVRLRENRIIDFFNRNTVAGAGIVPHQDKNSNVKIGAQSKLWRDYPDIIPSQEIVDALMELSSPENLVKMTEGVEQAKQHFLELCDYLNLHTLDQDSINHIKRSLAAIYNNIKSPQDRPISDEVLPTKTLINLVFKKIKVFTDENLNKMRETAEIMQLQVDIDKVLKLLPASAEQLRQIELTYARLNNKYKTLNWIKTTYNSRFLPGNLESYIHRRMRELNIEYPYKSKGRTIAINDEQYMLITPLSETTPRIFNAIGVKANQQTSATDAILIQGNTLGKLLAVTTADFLPPSMLPPALKKAVNYAQIAIQDSSHVVSIQPIFNPSQPQNRIVFFDELIFGKKGAYTPFFTYEMRRREDIKQFLARLSPEMKWQMAAAIYASKLAGDENLSMSQFQAEIDPQGNIIGIRKKITPAREQFTKAIEKGGVYNALESSSQYGSFGKNYIKYILQDKEIKSKYVALLHMSPAPELYKTTYDKMLSTLRTMPGQQSIQAIKEMLASINKGVSKKSQYFIPGLDNKTLSPEELKDIQESFAEIIAEITVYRAVQFHYAALSSEEINLKYEAELAQMRGSTRSSTVYAPVTTRKPVLSAYHALHAKIQMTKTEEAKSQTFSIQIHPQGTDQNNSSVEDSSLRIFLSNYLGNIEQGYTPIVQANGSPELRALYYAYAELFQNFNIPIVIHDGYEKDSPEIIQAKSRIAKFFGIDDSAPNKEQRIMEKIINYYLLGKTDAQFSNFLSSQLHCTESTARQIESEVSNNGLFRVLYNAESDEKMKNALQKPLDEFRQVQAGCVNSNMLVSRLQQLAQEAPQGKHRSKV